MHIISKSKLYILFNSLVFLSILLSLNYSVGNYVLALEERPFDLSQNYEIYEKNSISSSTFSNELNTQDADFVMILKQPEAIGIYDPMMYYYLKSINVVMPNELRYFSKEDYINKKNVSICIKGCSLFDIDYLKTLSTETNTKIINCFENSPLAVDNISIVHNLFSMKLNMGDHLYIDSPNKTTLNKLDSSLKKTGFKKLKKSDFKSTRLITAIDFGLQNKYSFYLIFANVMLLLLTVVTGYVYYSKMRRKIKLSFFYGCTVSSFFKTFFIPFNIIILLSNLLISVIVYLFTSELLYLSINNYLSILVIYQIFLMLVYFINFLNIYKEIKKGFNL